MRFVSNFTHLMAVLLWIGGIVALIAEMPQLAVAVWLVNLINGTFSFWQEFRASKATDALQKMLPSYVRVLRDAEESRISVEELVPGDVVLLSEGDKISADCRLVEQAELQIDQSTLTGESRPVNKTRELILPGRHHPHRNSQHRVRRDECGLRYRQSCGVRDWNEYRIW